MERSRNVEDLHHLRLMALLHELVRERDVEGRGGGPGSGPQDAERQHGRGRVVGPGPSRVGAVAAGRGRSREAAQAREEMRELARRMDGVEQRVDGLADEMGQGRGGSPARIAEASTSGNDTGGDGPRELQRLERRMGPAGISGRGWHRTGSWCTVRRPDSGQSPCSDRDYTHPRGSNHDLVLPVDPADRQRGRIRRRLALG